MSVSRMINSKFWSDSFVVDKLNPLDRYLFLYFLTNEKTNLAGVYEIPLRTIANETGLDKEEIVRMLERLKGKVEYKDGWVCLVNFVKHQNLNNKSIVKGIENEMKEVPESIDIWVKKARLQTSGIREGYERGTTTDNRIESNLIKSNIKEDTSAFHQFWNSYPKRENRKGCEGKWESKKLDTKIDEIISFIEKAKKSDRWKKGFIKAPLVFLNQESWNDDVSAYNDIKKTSGFIDLRTK